MGQWAEGSRGWKAGLSTFCSFQGGTWPVLRGDRQEGWGRKEPHPVSCPCPLAQEHGVSFLQRMRGTSLGTVRGKGPGSPRASRGLTETLTGAGSTATCLVCHEHQGECRQLSHLVEEDIHCPERQLPREHPTPGLL